MDYFTGMTDIERLRQLPASTPEKPLKVLMSACLTGLACGWDASSYGDYPVLLKILKSENVKVVRFCPEDFSFGTPREMCDIHGGSGIDVLDGKAKVLTASGVDWTEGMVKASEKMLEFAVQEEVDVAIMMDISAACGSQVVYEGNRFAEEKVYQIGAGVCGAQLIKNGINVISQRDLASLEVIFSKIDPDHQIDASKIDHHETEWYQTYFKTEEGQA